MRHAAGRVVRHRAAELLLGHVFVRHGLDHVRTGHEHVAGVLDHDVEVGNGRRVDRAAGARPHDRGDLRHDARRERVAEEDVGVAAERHHAFLNPRAARVVEADDRRPSFMRQVHDLDDLRGVGFRQRAAEHGEVLRKRKHLAAVDEAVPGDDAVAGDDLVGHPEVEAAVRDELVDFFEGAGSNSRSIRSRAVSLPASCCRRMRLRRHPARRGDRDRRGCVSGPSCRCCSRDSDAPSHGASTCRLVRLLPVLQKLLEPDRRQGMVEQLIDHGGRAGADVCADARRVDDVDRVAAAGDQHLGRELVVVVDLDDLADQIHPCGPRRRRAGRRTG